MYSQIFRYTANQLLLTPAALACACTVVAAGIEIIRAHDVAETVQAVRMTEAILAKREA
jgi:dihydropteroate synthase